MKTLEQVKNELAKEYGYDRWIDLYLAEDPTQDHWIDTIARRYAEEALREAANTFSMGGASVHRGVTKQSILDVIKKLE